MNVILGWSETYCFPKLELFWNYFPNLSMRDCLVMKLWYTPSPLLNTCLRAKTRTHSDCALQYFLIGLAQHVWFAQRCHCMKNSSITATDVRTTVHESPHTLTLALPDWSDGRKLMRMTRFLAKLKGARNPRGRLSESGHSIPSRPRTVRQRLIVQSLFKFQ